MDAYSSGEEQVIKTRKPYTITKQRERWTEEEHNRFLEALKLYGRAWQRIEEHIGTKTAIQIRSHAQKFFSKLEKEALAKGVPTGQTLDIEIPPPRPKRKPSYPYPRKRSAAISVPTEVKDEKSETPVSFWRCKQVLDLEKEPLERPNGDEKSSNLKEIQDDSCSEVFTHPLETNCSSVSLVNKNSMPSSAVIRNSSTFREFVPSLKETFNNHTSKPSDLENSCTSYEIQAQDRRKDDMDGAIRTDEMQATQNYPQHIAVCLLDGNLGTCAQNPYLEMPFQDSIFHPMGNVHGQANLFENPAASTTTEHQNNAPRPTHQTFPTFHTPFMHLQLNQEAYQSFLHVSSTFSNLIVSTLLQNPAAHAAASLAATFWPYANVQNSADSPTCDLGGFPSRQMNSATSMPAIAAATVAAATAWWAAHGLLSVCAPQHTGSTCTVAVPTCTVAVPPMENGRAPAAKTDPKSNADQDLSMQDQQLGHEDSEAMQGQRSASKSPTSSSSDCEESRDAKVNTEVKATAITEPQDANKTKNKKQVNRSSSGSNTPCSEMEIDVLEKHEKGKEDLEEADANHPQVECNSRRGRSSTNQSDSWKEVSEGGRLAFQALFSREVLPQSFSPPHDGKNKEQQNENVGEDKQNADVNNGETSMLHLTSQERRSCPDHREVENNALSKAKNIVEGSLLTIGLGLEKLKGRRTGFKPYKRCSVEAKESRVMNIGSQGDEKDPKRICLEGKAST